MYHPVHTYRTWYGCSRVNTVYSGVAICKAFASSTESSLLILRVLVCRNSKNRRIPLYSIFIDPSDYNYFAVSGRDQYARYRLYD